MSYGNYKHKSRGLTFSARIKFLRFLASSFPLNSIRVKALRWCGFKIGNQVYIGPELILTMMNSGSECFLEIEDRVAIAPRVTIILASDANWSHLNTIIKPIQGKVCLKKDCWLGSGCIILPNIIIGECSVVGAGAVVTKDVPAYSVVVGNPAKVIRHLKN